MTTRSEVKDLIAGAPLSAHLATSVDDRPHVAPVWYGYDKGVLSVLTGGKKLQNCRRNPRVAVSIEKGSERRVEWAVMLQGTAEVSEDPARIRDARQRIFPKYERGETDGGEDEAGNEKPAHALIEIAIGSATVQRY